MGSGTGYVRVGPRAEGLRGTYRFIRGRDIQTGKRHEGRWSDGQHAAFRFGCIGWFLVEVWLLFVGSWLPVYWFHVTLALLFIKAAHWAFFRIHNWAAVYFYAEPLAAALTELVGWPEFEPPSHWIHLPVGFKHRDGAVLRIDLKHKSAQRPEDQEQIVKVCAKKLGEEFDPDDATWNLESRKPHVLLRRPKPPPPEAWFVDHIERIENSRKRGEIVWGIGANDHLVRDNIAGETPMGAIVAQPMRGKSQALADAGCQFAHDGAILAVLDPKAGSLRCFKDIPNAVYAGTAEQADELIWRLYAEYERRTVLLGDRPHGTRSPVFTPILILIEEADGLVEQLRILNLSRYRTRMNCAAIAELLMLRNMGRELAMYQLMVTQSGDAKAAGSGGGRSAFAFFLGSCDRNSWKKITGAGEKHKPISPHKGRWHRFRNGELTEVQVFGFHDPPPGTEAEKMQEAREYALSGVVTSVPGDLKLDGTIRGTAQAANGTGPATPSEGADHGYPPLGHEWVVGHDGVSMGRPRHLTVVPQQLDPEEAVTLSEAVGAGVLPMGLDAARKASNRKGFPDEVLPRRPQPIGQPAKRYHRADLEAWAQGRERTHA